jgi:hypothetical protein
MLDQRNGRPTGVVDRDRGDRELTVHVLWLSAGLGCDGESVALTSATSPSLEDLLGGVIPGTPKIVLHNPLLAFEAAMGTGPGSASTRSTVSRSPSTSGSTAWRRRPPPSWRSERAPRMAASRQ